MGRTRLGRKMFLHFASCPFQIALKRPDPTLPKFISRILFKFRTRRIHRSELGRRTVPRYTVRLGESIPSVLKGMYSYSPYSRLLGNAHHIPQLNLDFRKAFFKRF